MNIAVSSFYEDITHDFAVIRRWQLDINVNRTIAWNVQMNWKTKTIPLSYIVYNTNGRWSCTNTIQTNENSRRPKQRFVHHYLFFHVILLFCHIPIEVDSGQTCCMCGDGCFFVIAYGASVFRSTNLPSRSLINMSMWKCSRIKVN